jgi:hypothetical protein
MSSTFTCPIRINKYNNPTNDGTIAADNTGAAQCTVQKAIAGTTAATVVVPAGSIISNVQAYITTAAGSTGTPNVTVNSTVVGTLSNDVGLKTVSFTADGATAALLSNVGTSDVTVNFTGGASCVGVLSVTYTPRNADGTITPYGSGYTNN